MKLIFQTLIIIKNVYLLRLINKYYSTALNTLDNTTWATISVFKECRTCVNLISELELLLKLLQKFKVKNELYKYNG